MHRRMLDLSIVIPVLTAATVAWAAGPAAYVDGTVRVLDAAHHRVVLDDGTQLLFEDSGTMASVHEGVTARFTYERKPGGKVIEAVELLAPGTLCGGAYRAGEGSNFAECPGAPEHFH